MLRLVSPQGKRRKPTPPARNVRDERGSRHKLAALAVFAVFVVGSLIVVAAAQGLGGPSVPEGDIAVIEDAPDGTITSEDFDRSLEQTAARQGLREVPPPDDPQYELLVDAAVSDLILSRWVLGEAEDRGIEVTDREIDEELETVINQQFGSQKAFEDFLDQSGFTQEEARERIALQLVSDRIQQAVLPQEPEITEDQLRTYYDENIVQFQQPETRDVRVILTRDEADADEAAAALAEDSSPQSFEDVAKEFSIDEATQSTGGLREAVVQGQSEPALDEQIFSAPEGELVGPFESEQGFYVIQVDVDHPGADDAVRRGPGADPADPGRRPPAGARDVVPGGFPGEVDGAHDLRRRLPHRPLLERGGPARSVHRGGRGDPGLRRAGHLHPPDRPRHRRRLRSAGAHRAAAGPDLPGAGDAAGRGPAGPDPGCASGRRPAGHRASRCRAAGYRPAGHRAAGYRRRPALRRPACRRAEPVGSMPDERRGGPEPDAPDAADPLERLDLITRRLRRECPWDREQDERSIVPHTVEEAYELADAAARGDDEKLRDELGDVLFQVLFLSLLLEERGAGSLDAVADGMSAKLIRRHPHVFGEVEAETATEVLRNWDQIKREVEGRGTDDPFADVPENLPGLLYARKILRRAEPEGGAPVDRERRDETEAAIGEMLLEAVRLSRRVGVDPELALRAAAERYREGT